MLFAPNTRKDRLHTERLSPKTFDECTVRFTESEMPKLLVQCLNVSNEDVSGEKTPFRVAYLDIDSSLLSYLLKNLLYAHDIARLL